MLTSAIQFCIDRLHGLPPDGRSGGRTFVGFPQLLERARWAIRRGELDLAEAFVMEVGDPIWASAPCLNLLGLIAEARGQWRRARQMWSRAARIDRHYGPADQNLRRYFELFEWGRTRYPVAFGDEPVSSASPSRSSSSW